MSIDNIQWITKRIFFEPYFFGFVVAHFKSILFALENYVDRYESENETDS